MDNYEKSIGLKTIGLTFVRHIFEILFIFIPVALAAYIVTNNFMTKTYISSVTVSKSTVFSTAQFQNLSLGIKATEITDAVAENLTTAGTKHANGTAITSDEIYSGIAMPSSYTNGASVSISFTFQSTDSTIVQPVLSELSTYAVNKLVEAGGDFATLKITSEASAASKNSSERKYFLIALVADAVLALGVPFIFEIVGDEVYDRKDIEHLGSDGFELKVSK